ncbi:hypothetical protein L6Q96_11920 [Candidatus Binatia bacterium]|nr:hypothetical protein [Candidatus Binatia bacterium]
MRSSIISALAILAVGVVSSNGNPVQGQAPAHPTLPECYIGDPDLLLPDLAPDTPADVRNVIVGGGRQMQFTTGVANIGDGPLVIEGRTISTGEGLVTQGYQILWRRDGSKCARATGRFEFHPTHEHWHFENFVGYELRRDNPRTGPLVAAGVKASYCLLDLAVARGYHPSRNPRQVTNLTCDSQEGIQGISVGWKDVYERFLPGQAIDLDRGGSPVPTGSYYLVNVVDPDEILWEKDRSNNLAAVSAGVSLRPPTGGVVGAPLPTVQATPRTQRPRLRPGRVRPTRPNRDVNTPTPRPTATPTVDGGRPVKPAKPTRPPRPGRGETPTVPVEPTATPTIPGGGGGTMPAVCESACRADISQMRLTWYDVLGLDFSAVIGTRMCGNLQPRAGAPVTIHMFDWMTDADLTDGSKDIGKQHTATFVLDASGNAVGSDGATVNFTSGTTGTTVVYQGSEPPIARMSDGVWFPVVFDVCVAVGDQAIRGRMVCQPKPRGLLCHEG